MTNPDLPPRRGAHRAPGRTMAAVLPSVLAVALVLAVVGVLYSVVGNRGTTEAGPGAATSTPTTASTPTTPPATTPSATNPPASTPPTTPSAPATAATSPAVSPSEPGAATSPSKDGPARPAVIVLNQSGQAGLAGRTAELLRGAGWTVSGTGNFRGTVTSTTVYYPPGQEEAAAALAADLPGTPDRIRPRFSHLSTTRLTVVLTSSYPG